MRSSQHQYRSLVLVILCACPFLMAPTILETLGGDGGGVLPLDASLPRINFGDGAATDFVSAEALEAQVASIILQATDSIVFRDLNLNGGDGSITLANKNVDITFESRNSIAFGDGPGTISFDDATNGIVTQGTGSITITAGTVGTAGADISSTGILTTAGGVVTLTADGTINVTGDIASNGGSVTANASGDFIASGDIAAGDIVITAGGQLTVNDLMTTGTGGVDLNADDNINVNADITAAGTGTISLNADNDASGTGAITRSNTSVLTQSAGTTTLAAASGIDLDTSTASVTFTNTTSGNVIINEADAVTVEGTNSATGGAITITANGDLTVGVGGLMTNGGDITLIGTCVNVIGDVITNGGVFNIVEVDCDTDGDGVQNADDVCPDTPAGAAVDAVGCSDAQVDADNDGVCDPDAESGGPSACTGIDAFPDDPTESSDNDNDGVGDHADPDDDNDGIGDALDTQPLISSNLCTGGDGDNATLGIQIVSDLTCAAQVSIDVQPATQVLGAPAHLHLIAPSISFQSGFRVLEGGQLSVISADPCPGCGGNGELSLLTLMIQPISICLDDGTSCADSTRDELGIDMIWGQAVIDVEYLPLQTLNDTSLRFTLTCVEVLQLVTNPGDPPPVNLYYTDCGSGASEIAWIGANGIVMNSRFIGLAKIEALAIGHNLGLVRMDTTDVMNLMDLADIGGTLLDAAQITTARASSLLE